MKQGKAPTRNEREIIANNGLPWKDYEVLYFPSDFYMKIRHKDTGKTKLIDKNLRKRR